MNLRNEFFEFRRGKFIDSQFHKRNRKRQNQSCNQVKTVESEHFFALQNEMIKSDEQGGTTDYFKQNFHYFLRFSISLSTIFLKSSNSFSDKFAEEVKKEANCKAELLKKFLIIPFI